MTKSRSPNEIWFDEPRKFDIIERGDYRILLHYFSNGKHNIVVFDNGSEQKTYPLKKKDNIDIYEFELAPGNLLIFPRSGCFLVKKIEIVKLGGQKSKVIDPTMPTPKKEVIFSEIDKSKETIFIFQEERSRSLLANEFFSELTKTKSCNIVLIQSSILSIEDIVKRVGVWPTKIVIGFGVYRTLFTEVGEIKKRKIKVYFIVGDITEFMRGEYYNKAIQTFPINTLIIPLPVNGIGNVSEFMDYVQENPFLKNVNIVNCPFSVPSSLVEVRDIDVSFICTRSEREYHRNRMSIYSILSDMKKRNVCNIYLDSVFGESYYNILKRTKIFVVETSMRGAFSQKYIEGPICGCMLMGEVPKGVENILIDQVTMSEIKDYEQELEKMIIYYLKRPELIRSISSFGKNTIIDKFAYEKIENVFLSCLG